MRQFALRIVVLSALAGLLALPAAAATVVIDLDTEFSGATAPAGAAPWVRGTFLDVAGGVRLTISALNLTGTEYISSFYFNFNPAMNSATYFPSAPGTGTQTAWDSISAGNDQWKPDGDGFFDYRVEFPTTAGPGRFTAGETFVLEWLGSGLSVVDFDYASVNGPPGNSGFFAAAHVQSIGPNGADSGWIGGSNSGLPDVPEPSSLLLLGVGISILGLVVRKRTV